jgi:hypothetical protein
MAESAQQDPEGGGSIEKAPEGKPGPTFEAAPQVFEKEMKWVKVKVELLVKFGGNSEHGGITHGHEISPTEQAQVVKASLRRHSGRFFAEIEGRVKFDPHELGKAIRNRSTSEFIKALFGVQATAGASVYKTKAFGGEIECEISGGADIDALPILIVGGGKYVPDDVKSPIKLELELKAHVGPSKEGWIAIIKWIGKDGPLRFCLQQGKTRLLTFLVSDAAIIGAGAVIGTYALVGLGAYVTGNAKVKAAQSVVKSAYRKGFVDTLFPKPSPFGPGAVMSNPTREERETIGRLWEAGRKDAIEAALAALAKQKVKVDPHWDDEEKAMFYGNALKIYYHSMGRDAEAEIGENVGKRAQALML